MKLTDIQREELREIIEDAMRLYADYNACGDKVIKESSFWDISESIVNAIEVSYDED